MLLINTLVSLSECELHSINWSINIKNFTFVNVNYVYRDYFNLPPI